MTETHPSDAPIAAAWLDLDGAPALVAGRCSACTRAHLPRRPECPWCAADTVSDERRTGGVVVAATTTASPVPGGEGPFHTVVLVDMGDGLLAAGRATDHVTSGDQVTVGTTTLHEGEEATVVHSFTPNTAMEAPHA